VQNKDRSPTVEDFSRWKDSSSEFSPGDLVMITSQPYFEDETLVGKIGIVLKKTMGIDYINHLYWEILIEGEICSIHYRNIVKLGDKDGK
tara:strand:- start:356 stop:625 length:270 start_codon:yes stop_codon:yes gene_type:complete